MRFVSYSAIVDNVTFREPVETAVCQIINHCCTFTMLEQCICQFVPGCKPLLYVYHVRTVHLTVRPRFHTIVIRLPCSNSAFDSSYQVVNHSCTFIMLDQCIRQFVPGCKPLLYVYHVRTVHLTVRPRL